MKPPMVSPHSRRVPLKYYISRLLISEPLAVHGLLEEPPTEGTAIKDLAVHWQACFAELQHARLPMPDWNAIAIAANRLFTTNSL